MKAIEKMTSSDVKQEMERAVQALPQGTIDDGEYDEGTGFEFEQFIPPASEDEMEESEPEPEKLFDWKGEPVDEQTWEKNWNEEHPSPSFEKNTKESYNEVPEGYPSPEMQQQAMAAFGRSVFSDMDALGDRYGDDLVKKFDRDYRLGKVKIPRGIDRTENALERMFLHWVDKTNTLGRMTTQQVKDLLEAARGVPLRTQSLDMVNPGRNRPKPKPRPQRRGARKIPEFSEADGREMMADYLAKYPERFGQ